MDRSSRKVQRKPLPVFGFLDALEYLRQAYELEKSRDPVFSQRYIAKAMGARSSSFFQDVLTRKASLNSARIHDFARLFRLAGDEADYFENLVLYNQAETEVEKRHYLGKLASQNRSDKATLLSAFQMEYFKKWYYAAVRELLAIHSFKGDYAKLGKMLVPPIGPKEAEEAVDLLVNLGLARKNAQGALERVDKVLRSPSNVDPARLRPSLRSNLELAIRALDQFPPEARPFSYLTLSVSPESFAQIRDRLRQFRKEILAIVDRDEAVDRLYQLNFQFFPISIPEKPRKK